MAGLLNLFTGHTKFKAKPVKLDQNLFTNANYPSNRQQVNGLLSQYQNQVSPTMAAAQLPSLAQTSMPNMDNFNSISNAQNGLSNLLMQQAQGTAPSPAEIQMRQGMQQNLASQMALAGSSAGGTNNPSLTMRTLQNNLAGINQDTDVNASILRAQQMQAAQQGLAGLYSQQQGQNLAAAGLNLGANQFNVGQQNTGLLTQGEMNQQAASNNLQASIQHQSQVNAMVQNLLSQGFSLDEAQRQANIAYEQMLSNNQNAVNSVNAGIAMQNANNGQKFGGSLLNMASALPGMGFLSGSLGGGNTGGLSSMGLNPNALMAGGMSASQLAGAL